MVILGTTISPYLFFWQAAQEVEDRRANVQKSVTKRGKAKPRMFQAVHVDVVTGMVFSNLIMYFIILTTAASLHAHG